MNNLTLEELEYEKAVIRIAYSKGRIDKDFYNDAMKHFSDLERELLQNDRLKAIKMNKLKSKLNLLVTK